MLQRFIEHVKKEHIDIITTQQLIDEFDRNRNKRLKEDLDQFNEIKIQDIPTIFKNAISLYEELIGQKKGLK